MSPVSSTFRYRLQGALIAAACWVGVEAHAGDEPPVRDLRITMLSTNMAGNPGMSGMGEWGFGALVEVDGKRWLFDTGHRADTVLNNAAELDLSLEEITDVILSHNHGDHRRLAQRRDAVLLDAAPGDFIESNIETAIRSEVGLEGGVDSSLQELFEVGVVPTVRQFLRPHVLIESIKILGRFLADFLAQNFEQGPSLRRVLDEPIDFGEVRVAAPRSNCPRSKSGLLLAFPDRLLRPQ